MDKKDEASGSKKRKREKKEEGSKLEPPIKKRKLDDEKKEVEEKYNRTYTGVYNVSDMMNGGRREQKVGSFDSLEEANKAANDYYESLKNDPTLVRMYGKDHCGDEMIEEGRPGCPMNKFMTCGFGSSSHMVYVEEAFPQTMQIRNLKKALAKRNLSTKGKKNELVKRLEKDITLQKKK